MSDRAEFEAWARDFMLADITRREDGEYEVRETSDLWQAWCAARRWRPISEAPKDGTTVIVGRDMGESWGFVMGHGYYMSTNHNIPGIPNIEGRICKGFVDPPGELGLGNPTHFHKIPEPPHD